MRRGPRLTGALPALMAGLVAAGCATVPGEYPNVRYAEAASVGPVALRLAGRPSADDLVEAERRWAEAVGDAYACGLPGTAVTEAGMIGALELAAMTAASRGSDQGSTFEGLLGYVSALGERASRDSVRPSQQRCERLGRWVDDVRRDGRATLRREAANGLIPEPG